MKALFIGGTGTLSESISRLALERGWDLYLLNRNQRPDRTPDGAHTLTADINDEPTVTRLLARHDHFDVVANFIAYQPADAARDLHLFRNRCAQYIFISSASAYQKPPTHHVITETTPLANPYWQYARDKIACEQLLQREHETTNFPLTIVRPSHTYDQRKIPLAVQGTHGFWQVIDRMRQGKPVLIHGDGTSLWTTTHSHDFAQAFLGLMGNQQAIGEAIQITSDESLTWNAMYDIVATALGVEAHKLHVPTDFLAACNPDMGAGLLGDKAHSIVFDNTKIKKLVPNWTAQINYAAGIERSLAFILNHPELQTPDPEFDTFCNRMIEVQSTAINHFKT